MKVAMCKLLTMQFWGQSYIVACSDNKYTITFEWNNLRISVIVEIWNT